MSEEEHARFGRMARLIAAESAPIAERLEAHGVAQHAALLASRGVTLGRDLHSGYLCVFLPPRLGRVRRG